MLNSKENKFAQFVLNIALIILSLLIIMPFLLLVCISFSSEKDIAVYGYGFLIKNFDLSAYKYIFRNASDIFQAYKVTAGFSFITMVLSVLLMSMVAYPLTKRELRGRQAISFYLYFTMLFSGGLVPLYILITRYLHLDDTIWVYILPGLISPWFVFMLRTFFSSLPEAILESAEIDGLDEIGIFCMMVLPLSKSVLAAVSLFVLLGQWNNWYTSMLYINNEKLLSLQYLLQKIMMNINLLQQNSGTFESSLISIKDIPTETVRMAMAVVVAGPALLVFPFFQKYFVKGITVGSVKG